MDADDVLLSPKRLCAIKYHNANQYKTGQCGSRAMTESKLAVFENYKIRRHYDEETETWYFSVVDILKVLIQQSDYQ